MGGPNFELSTMISGVQYNIGSKSTHCMDYSAGSFINSVPDCFSSILESITDIIEETHFGGVVCEDV